MFIFMVVVMALMFWWNIGWYTLSVYTGFLSLLHEAEDLSPYNHVRNFFYLMWQLTAWPHILIDWDYEEDDEEDEDDPDEQREEK